MASKLSLTIVLNKNTGKVLFAEAGKDFIEFLFSLLALPIGYVSKLLRKQHMVGCTGSIYNSLVNLSVDYMQHDFDINTLINPNMSIPMSGQNPLVLLQVDASTKSKYYSCCDNPSCGIYDVVFHHRWITDDKCAACPSCHKSMVENFVYVRPKHIALGSDGGGCVKGAVTYMVMDDLVVTPMSTVSSISLLNKYQVRDVSALKEKVVEVGIDEGLALLKASLESKTVLTDVFGEKSKKVPGLALLTASLESKTVLTDVFGEKSKKVPGLAPVKSSLASTKRAFTGGFAVKLEHME